MNNNLNGWMMLNYTAAYFYSEGNPFGIVFLILLLLFQLSKLIVSHILDNRQFDSVEVETSFTNKRQNRIKHFVYDSLMNLPSSSFVLVLDKGTNLVSPAVYTKQNNRISMINRNAEYTAFEHIELSDDTYSGEYTFIRTCKVKDKKTGEQVLFAAVPNRETNILAYSDSAHKSDKTVTFGKFRIFCFVESENSPYTDLLADSEKIHLEKTKRKGMHFIGLNEVIKTNPKSKK